MKKKEKAKKDRLKAPIKLKRWSKEHGMLLVTGAVIIALLLTAIFITYGCSAKSARREADQATKRLSELKIEQEQEEIQWETEKEIEIKLRMEEARVGAQAEAAIQMAELNKKLSDQDQSYKDLEKSMDDLMKTYEELMKLISQPVSFLPGGDGAVIATVKLANGMDRYFPKGLDPLIDIYLGWEDKFPEGYANLVKWGRAFTMGDSANYPLFALDPAMFESCIIAYDSARLRCFLDMYNRKSSPYYGDEIATVRYLRQHNRDWYSMIAICELESTCGMGSSNHFGILDGEFSRGKLEDYIGYLHKWQMRKFDCESNDLTKIAQVYNDHAEWRSNFYQLAGDLRTWYP
jgi:hypothetical protein